jgi:phosphatidate cytidylyltransferase
MLKQRLLTAVILIPLVLWVLTLSSQTFAWVTGIFIIVGAYEWAGLCAWHTKRTRMFYTMLVILLLTLAYWFRHELNLLWILFGTCIWWIVALIWLLRYQYSQFSLPTSKRKKAFLGILILLPPWMALIYLHEHENYGWQWVVFLLVLIWVADSGAYFVGKRWGKIKLADKISPGKTYEGVAGAFIMSLIVSLGYALTLSLKPMTLFFFMLLCLLTIMASILGDLLESLFKRQAGIKDSSQILPGHGGILDRIDSLTAATPIFVIGLISLGSVF